MIHFGLQSSGLISRLQTDAFLISFLPFRAVCQENSGIPLYVRLIPKLFLSIPAQKRETAIQSYGTAKAASPSRG